MLNRILSFSLLFLFLGEASTQALDKDEVVTILLNDGNKIEAQISDISHDRVEFKAKSSKKAYEYGEVLNIERIRGLKLKNGMVLSVKEYRAYLKDGSFAGQTNKVEATPVTVETKLDVAPGSDLQSEALKNKPISEMTPNEFEYFMMMKEKEKQAAAETATVETSKAVQPTVPTIEEKASAPTIQPAVVIPEQVSISTPPANPSASDTDSNDELVNTLIAADLAPALLNYLHEKSARGETLTVTEATLSERIQSNSKWQEKLDDIKYLDRVSFKAMERAYLYNPDELQNQLGLKFDRDAEMNFADLMDQLHRRTGSAVRMGDFRILADLFDESGARAIKDLLENYETWEFATQSNRQFTDKQ